MAAHDNSLVTKPATPGVVVGITCNNSQKLINWIKAVFKAEQFHIHLSEDNKRVYTCSLCINGGYIYISDPLKELDQDPKDYEAEPAGFMLSVELKDPSEIWQLALANGAKKVQPLGMQDCGHFYGIFKDPLGFPWCVVKMPDSCTPGVVPYMLNDQDCGKHVQWLVSSLDAVVKDKSMKGEKVEHCTLEINNSSIYLADSVMVTPSLHHQGNRPSKHLTCHMNVPDPHLLWERAVAAGVRVQNDLKIQFYGILSGTFEDTMGYQWSLNKAGQDGEKDVSYSPGISPYILSSDCQKHLEWVQRVFGAGLKTIYRSPESNKIMHCSLKMEEGDLLLCDRSCGPNEDDSPPPPPPPPPHDGNSSSCIVMVHVRTSDPDRVWGSAMSNDAVQVIELKQQDWGGYYGCFRDPLGVQWGIMKPCEKM